MIGQIWKFSRFRPGVFYNRTEPMRDDAKEWVIGNSAAYLSKPILLFCRLFMGWPIVKGIWRWASKPVPNVGPPLNDMDGWSNPATAGGPSENDDDEFIIPKM